MACVPHWPLLFAQATFPIKFHIKAYGGGAPGWDSGHHPVQPLCLQKRSLGLGAIDWLELLWQSQVLQGPERLQGCACLPVPEEALGLRKAVTAGLRATTLSGLGERRGRWSCHGRPGLSEIPALWSL